jgi:hypothetical protein
MSTRTRRVLTGIGFVSALVALGFALATPFLPLSPFWQQSAVGFALVGLQMAIWLGPAMGHRVADLRRGTSNSVMKADREGRGESSPCLARADSFAFDLNRPNGEQNANRPS